MIKVSREQMKTQVDQLTELSKVPSIIYFDEFVKSLAPLYSSMDLPDQIRIAKDEDSLLRGDYEPAYVLNIKENKHLLEYKGLNMWRNLSNDQLSLHGLGLIEGNRAAPSRFTLFDTNPHGNIGGATGHGKSVLANSIIVSASLVHPPWLVQYYLSDPKITEMKPYATSPYKLPHVNCVAATEDPEYAISVLEYLLAIMDKRASIFNNVRVKNIDGFNKAGVGLTQEEKDAGMLGIQMPMMVLVLDELKAMLQTAGRRAGHVDKLIQAFVAKARFAGGRCIMLSQGVVTELDPATMKNVNIRIALGCTPGESEALVGNPGAAVNLGSMGKITFNNTPMKALKDNVYLSSPFLPDKANEFTNNIYDIFEHQHKVWEKLTYPGARISPLSFFDQTAPLTREDFKSEIEGKVSTSKIFTGEPVYINKSDYKMAYINFEPNDEYSDNLGNNVLFISKHARERLNFLATLLLNFDELRKSRELDVRIYSPLNDNNKTIEGLGYKVDGYYESGDVADAFARNVQQAYLKILAIKTDEIVYAGRDPEPNKLFEPIIESLNKKFGRISPIMVRRVNTFLTQLQDQLPQQIFGLPGPLDARRKSESEYLNYATYLLYFYEDFGCKSQQLTAKNTPIDIRVFFNFHMVHGTETKTNRSLDLWMNVVKMAPVYGVHFIIVTQDLRSCGGSLNGVCNKIFFYYPENNSIAQHKLNDDYPNSTLECVYIYADKTLTNNICVKVKKVEMLD